MPRRDIELPEDVQERLDQYREVYDEWQRYVEANYNEPFSDLSDEVLLRVALGDAIRTMRTWLERSREYERTEKAGRKKQ